MKMIITMIAAGAFVLSMSAPPANAQGSLGGLTTGTAIGIVAALLLLAAVLDDDDDTTTTTTTN